VQLDRTGQVPKRGEDRDAEHRVPPADEEKPDRLSLVAGDESQPFSHPSGLSTAAFRSCNYVELRKKLPNRRRDAQN
jgi:hypothetical protein